MPKNTSHLSTVILLSFKRDLQTFQTIHRVQHERFKSSNVLDLS